MRYLDYYDREILRLLARTRTEMTVNEISEKLGMSWVTVDSHLSKLFDWGYVLKRRVRSRTYWWANY